MGWFWRNPPEETRLDEIELTLLDLPNVEMELRYYKKVVENKNPALRGLPEALFYLGAVLQYRYKQKTIVNEANQIVSVWTDWLEVYQITQPKEEYVFAPPDPPPE